MGHHCQLFEEYGADSVVEFCQLEENGGVHGHAQRELLIDSRDAVDEVGEILLLLKIAWRQVFQPLFQQTY